MLSSGAKIGAYEVASLLGKGGMGEVYRARDAKLGRDVAIKVLPEAFARDSERMARFQREAKVLASLDHPNIATIHGLEETGGIRALVMQLVEGPTLADRIKHGPIPIDEAIRIARQIADALEYAHERGIVHRDLKPANIKVAADDTVKVLDFGLAKALEADASSIDISTSPTISRMATQQGVLLGTAAYMSPEQAKAKQVDRRADVWAFGCVLYEMLTGKQAFQGESMSDTLAAVIRAEPDWSKLPPATPMRVRVLLQRCLQKDTKQRLRDIGDARISLEEVLSGAPEAAPPASAPVLPASQPLWRRALPPSAAILAVAIAGFAGWNLKPLPAKPVIRTVITLPAGQRLTLPPGERPAGLDLPLLALSDDGSQLAYVATTQGAAPQIYLRAMDGFEAKPIPGTEGAISLFFSPDGQWIGFFADGKMKKIPVDGGVAQVLADASIPVGGSWGSQGTIAFAPILSVLQQVSDGGGPTQPITHFENGESIHGWPDFLPGNRAVLFFALPSDLIAVQRLDTGERRDLIPGQLETMPRYASSGHLIYSQANSLMAIPFDLGRLEIKGAARPVVQGILGGTQYSVSVNGTLAYVPGGPEGAEGKLVWVSRNGAEQALAAPARGYAQPRLSPDGRRIAVDVTENGESQLGLYDVARDTLSRFTFEGSMNEYPVWSPDGKRIVFSSNRDGPMRIFWQLADGGGSLERLTNGNTEVAFSWSPDGQLLAFVGLAPGGPEFFVLPISGRKPLRFLKSQAFEDAPQFSPDGRWLAYTSDESGRREIYVQPYPGPGGRWQISTEGGSEPQWNHNGRELFYRLGDKMMAVDIATMPSFAAGKPRQLFEGHYMTNVLSRPNYDVSADGQRFLMIKPVEQAEAAPTQINVVLNWTEELKRLVPTGK